VILGVLVSSERWHVGICAACAAPTARCRSQKPASSASPSVTCSFSRLFQGQDRCPSLQFHTGGRGVRLPPALPFGPQLLRALRGLYDLAGACSNARTAPCPCTAPTLTACCLRSRLAGCSSYLRRNTTIFGSLGISSALCTHLHAHILRADAIVGSESARRVIFARVRRQVPGSSWDPYGLHVHM